MRDASLSLLSKAPFATALKGISWILFGAALLASAPLLVLILTGLLCRLLAAGCLCGFLSDVYYGWKQGPAPGLRLFEPGREDQGDLQAPQHALDRGDRPALDSGAGLDARPGTDN